MKPNMEQSNIVRILDAVEQESFLNPTFIASGHETVADIIGETPEVQALLDHKSSSLPLMRARYRERNAMITDGARLVYFVVFGLAHDREMIRDIISYLKSCRSMSTSTLLWPWHPFLHGMHALEKITGGQIQAPKSSGSMKQVDEFLTRVLKWEETHTDPLD